MKRKLIHLFDILVLYKKYWKYYLKFNFGYKRKIIKKLKANNISKLSAVSKSEWKLWYNCCYFSGKLNTTKEKVFIKIMGPLLQDCFYNEILVNKFLGDNSQFLLERTPRLLDSYIVDDFYILVYTFNKLDNCYVNDDMFNSVREVILEYTTKKILHTDFGKSNIGYDGEKYIFFDYGTSICPLSDNIRIRNSSNYNHKDKAIPKAISLVNEPDFYYDDVIHLGLFDIDREDVNFLVGKNGIYYSSLGDEIIKYQLIQQERDPEVFLLVKI